MSESEKRADVMTFWEYFKINKKDIKKEFPDLKCSQQLDEIIFRWKRHVTLKTGTEPKLRKEETQNALFLLMDIVKLRTICSQNKLPFSGNKTKLTERLMKANILGTDEDTPEGIDEASADEDAKTDDDSDDGESRSIEMLEPLSEKQARKLKMVLVEKKGNKYCYVKVTDGEEAIGISDDDEEGGEEDDEPADKGTEAAVNEGAAKKETAKKETDKKEKANKETAKKETDKKEADKKEADKKEAANELTKKKPVDSSCTPNKSDASSKAEAQDKKSASKPPLASVPQSPPSSRVDATKKASKRTHDDDDHDDHDEDDSKIKRQKVYDVVHARTLKYMLGNYTDAHRKDAFKTGARYILMAMGYEKKEVSDASIKKLCAHLAKEFSGDSDDEDVE